MATSISRRVIFIKLKRKPIRRQKPKMEPERKPTPVAPENDVMIGDEPMIGEPAKPHVRLRIPPPATVQERRLPWKTIGLWGGALLLVVLAILAAVKFGPKGRTSSVEARATSPSALSYPGRTDRSYGGYPGASDVHGSVGGSAASSVPTVEGFLAAPFNKRKTCVVQAGAGSVADFSKCLDESREELSKTGK